MSTEIRIEGKGAVSAQSGVEERLKRKGEKE
jgi:hypothetical protein